MNPVALLYAIIGISFLVLIHELGHYLFAKLFNVYVFEFAIGMGPKLLTKRKGETDYSIRAFPIGGFVSMAGENMEEFLPDEKYIDENGEEKTRKMQIPVDRTINGLNNFKKFLVISAGVIFNFILCFILLVVVFLVDGIPMASNQTQRIRIQPGSYAAEAGLLRDDIVIKISGYLSASEGTNVAIKEVPLQDYKSYATLSEVLDKLSPTTAEPGQKQCVSLTVKRDPSNPVEVCRVISEVETIKEGDVVKGYYAKSPMFGLSVGREPANFSQAIDTAFYYEGQMMLSIFQIFDNLENIGGPVAIYTYVEASVASGFIDFVWLLALLSANLGIVNLLPIPGLDGGRLVMIIGETITRKKFPRKAEAIINTVGLFILFGIMILITFKDIIGLF